MSNISNSTVNFLIWISTKTTSIQGNVRNFDGKYYFTDRARGSGVDGGIKQLWDIYVNEMVG